jgi:antitoxin CptB
MRFAAPPSLHSQPPEDSFGTSGAGSAHNDALHQSDPLRRARLRWRSRRGLLENDLIFERFFSRYEESLSDADVGALTRLFELSDNDLMDLLLARKEPEGELSDPDIVRVLGLLRAV